VVSESGIVNRLMLYRRFSCPIRSDTHLLALLSDNVGGGIAINSNGWERGKSQHCWILRSSLVSLQDMTHCAWAPFCLRPPW